MTGEELGTVGRHEDEHFHGGRWSAWGPFSPEAVGQIKETMAEAALELLDPENLRPVVLMKVCRACCNTIPRPRVCTTGECETREEATARSRLEDADEWGHYDFLVSLGHPQISLPLEEDLDKPTALLEQIGPLESKLLQNLATPEETNSYLALKAEYEATSWHRRQVERAEAWARSIIASKPSKESAP